ncbi:homeobox-leucine zipper protein HDG11-like [Vicia villosa]|uniref:homeobox-leucine zipper protein HDG11-like n=1 Tax=Vicia villosa TaxID=3911 RepID=UPI00273CA6EF|nr:homeobox-leucine zipper protein HDG11-like [Vicia villosa]
MRMKEALKAKLCITCGGPPIASKEHELSIQKMEEQNIRLKEEVEKASTLLARYTRKEISQLEFEQSIAQTKAFARNLDIEIPLRQETGGSSSHNHNHAMPVKEPKSSGDVEKSIISQIAAVAMNELVTLVRINEPFWVDSSSVEDEISTLSHEIYEQTFPKPNHFKGENVVKESSKYTSHVNINSMELIDMLLDPVKWAKLFPTIVSKSETIKVFENGLMGNRDGALQLMYEQMHILSPLVQPREFTIIRYCKQIDVRTWVITDVSYDSSLREISPPTRSWKHPSGCLIRELSVDFCSVTWVEHVELDDKMHTHHLYKYLIDINNLYGAKSWIKELQRMCEKSASFYVQRIPDQESEGGYNFSTLLYK